MKTLFLGLVVLSASLSAQAAKDKREYTKVSPLMAIVSITTADSKTTQAANYVDSRENKKFLHDLLLDPSSPLAKTAREIELQICSKNSTDNQLWIPGCGGVTITKDVRTSFGRSGWESAGAAYTFFIGFTHDGSGNTFEVTHMGKITESVDAQVNNNGEYVGTVIKVLSLSSINKL